MTPWKLLLTFGAGLGVVALLSGGRLQPAGSALAQGSALSALVGGGSRGCRTKTHVRNKAWHHPLVQTPDLN